jgi:hypothetical protein
VPALVAARAGLPVDPAHRNSDRRATVREASGYIRQIALHRGAPA